MNIRSLQWCAGIGAASIAMVGCGGSDTVNTNLSQYVQHNLVGSKLGQAPRQDVNVVNAWGLAASPTGPWWLANNGTGLSNAINGDGSATAVLVTIPAVGGSNGPVTGEVFNGTADFAIPAVGPSHFIYASEDGLITAWSSGSAAVTVADQSAAGAKYKGLAMGANGGANFLYATDFHNNKVDVFDKNFAKVSSFTDATLPANFAPFGIANVGGMLYITFANQDAAKSDEVKGAGLGYVDVFNPDGTMVKRFISQGALNAPWGIAKAPSTFGSMSNDILIGNFGDGTINAYDSNGVFQGAMQNPLGHSVTIVGLWALAFGNDGSAGSSSKLFFTAGPRDEQDGLFGEIEQTF